MKRNWLNKAVLVVCATAAWQVGLAQPVNSFSVVQCVDYGTKNSIQVKNALLDVKVQEQFNKEITSAAFPQVSGSISTNYFPAIPVQTLPDFISPSVYQVLVDQGVKNGSGNTIAFPSGGFGNIPARFGTTFTASGGIDVTQLLFDGQVFVGLQARKAGLEFYRKSVEVTQEQIKANIYKVYYQLVVGKKQLESFDANIERLNKLLHDVTELYKNGFAEKLAIDKVTVQLNNLKTEKVKVENMLEAGHAGLKFLMGMPQKESLVLTDTLSEQELKKGILEEAVGYDNRKDIQFLYIAKQLGEYNIRRYKLSYLPTVAAFGSFSKNAQRNQFDFFGRGDWFSTAVIGFKISVPIYDGGNKRAKLNKAMIDLERTNNNIAQLKELIDSDIEQAKIKMKTALLTMDNQKQNIELAQKVYGTTKLKYEQGLGGNDEVYNAFADLRVAQNNYYSALYDAINAKIDYLKTVGKL
jgi:outer membrane protein